MKLPHAASNRGQCSNSQPEGRPRPSQRQEAHIPPCSYFHSVHAIGSPAPSLLEPVRCASIAPWVLSVSSALSAAPCLQQPRDG